MEPNPDGRSGKQTSLGSPLLPSLPERSRNYAPVLISSEKKGQVSTSVLTSAVNMAEETRNAVFGRVPKFPARTYIFDFPA